MKLEFIEEDDIVGKTAEDKVINYYIRKGYKVIRSVKERKIQQEIIDFLHKKKMKINLVEDSIRGVPDFFIYNDNEFFFVEVKSGNGVLSIDQLEWSNMNMHIPHKVVVIRKDKKKYKKKEEKLYNIHVIGAYKVKKVRKPIWGLTVPKEIKEQIPRKVDFKVFFNKKKGQIIYQSGAWKDE